MSEEQAGPPEAAHAATDMGAESVRGKATSRWFLMPVSRAGWVVLALALGPIAFVGVVAALSRLL